ncbi:MAG: malonyl CoA-acyl carrier protein transacylase, partial [Methyloceanibacter sp.]
MSIALIFPGQGSQAVGMGAELAKAYPAAQAVFSEV